MTRILIYLMALISPAIAVRAAHTIDDIPNVHVADRTQYVSNPDGILSSATVDTLNARLARIWASTSAEPVIVAIDDISDQYSVNDFATRIFENWGIGKKDTDNGLLILLVRDRHNMVIRTGYGLEGVMPDVICGKIIRNDAIPHFRLDDYDAGMIAAVDSISSILTDPTAADEIRSAIANDSRRDSDDGDFFIFMLQAGAVMALIMLAIVIATIIGNRNKDELERYRKLNNIKPVALFLSFIGLGMPLIAYLLCIWQMHRLREHKRKCPNCGQFMRKLDEITDNEYLTPTQDAEERLNSIDYDVWLCDACGEKDVIPYINKQSSYTVCPLCGARTNTLVGNRIIAQPTTHREGRGERIYSCRNCRNTTTKPYAIEKLAPPVIFIGGGGSGFGGGGGISGGSFGGGMTGGGGASGGW